LGEVLDAVRIESDAPVDQKGLMRALPFRIGQPITAEQMREADRLLEIKGIFHSWDISLERGPHGVTAVVRLERKRVISTVEITGNESIWDRDVLRVVRLRAATVYEPDQVDAAAERLRQHYRSIGFPDVAVTVEAKKEDGEVSLRFAIHEGAPEIITAVAIEGAPLGTEDDLRDAVKDLEGKRRQQKVGRDSERKLIAELRDHGFYEARVDSSWESNGAHGGVLHFGVDPGPPYVIQMVGNEKVDRHDLLGVMNLRERLIITDGTWRELARRMREAYRQRGYYRAAVEVKVGDEIPRTVRFQIHEGRRYAVRRIRFEGNDSLSDRQLRGQMETAPRRYFPWPRSGVLIPGLLNDDLDRIRHLYHQRGFEDVRVQRAPLDIDDASGAIAITIHIEEGARRVVREVVRPKLPVPRRERPVLKVRRDEPYEPAALDEDRQAILKALRRNGYRYARAEASVEERPRDVNAVDVVVRWAVEPGEQAKIGRIFVSGNIDTRDRAILREVPFHSGDPLDTDQLLSTQTDIYDMGLFQNVTIQTLSRKRGAAPGEEVEEKGAGDEGEEPREEPRERKSGDQRPTVRDVDVSVIERPAGSVRWGAGYNTRDGISNFFEASYGNIGGMARRLTGRAQFSLEPPGFTPTQYLGLLGYREPRFFGSHWRYDSNLVGERSTRSVDAFNIERYTFANGFDRQLGWKSLHGGVELEAEYSDVFDVEPDAVLSPHDEGALHSFSVGPSLTYDGRNDPLLPHSGIFDALRFRYVLPEISSIELFKASLQHTQLVPIRDGVIFVYSGRLAWARTLEGNEQVPIRQRLFLGGRTTVRGFGENSIGPRGAEGHVTGGDFAVNGTLELRFPILYGFGGAVFLDGGGLYLVRCDSSCRQQYQLRGAQLSFDNFRRSAGFGLRYETPVGPISLDYGIKLDRRSGESFGALHFSIGTTF
jgi:outer membrane protein insertion porin family